MDGVYATLVTLALEERVQFCGGFVLCLVRSFDSRIYSRGGGAARFPGSARMDWTTDQRELQRVIIRGGGAKVTYRLKDWFTSGRCSLQSPAASGLVADIQQMPEWLQARTVLRPCYLSGETGQDEGVSADEELFTGLPEHFRSRVLTDKGPGWVAALPCMPATTEELYDLMSHWEQRDEIKALGRLRDVGSSSACILRQLDLSRAVVAEALSQLQRERKQQVNLVGILGATRYKALVHGRVYHMKCARPQCVAKDSFDHMLQCCDLQKDSESGEEAAPFLSKIATVAMIPLWRRRIPYSEEYRAARRVDRVEPDPEVG